MSADGDSAPASLGTHRTRPDTTAACGRPCGSGASPSWTRTTPGGAPRHTCSASARVTASAKSGGPTTATPAPAGTVTGAPSSRRAARCSSRDATPPSPPATRRRLAASPRPTTSTSVRPGTGRQISSGSPANAATSGCCAHFSARSASCRVVMVALSRASASAVSRTARLRCRRAPRRASRAEAPMRTGPSAANQRAKAEPVMTHRSTAPSTGATADSTGSGARGAWGGAAGSVSGSSRSSGCTASIETPRRAVEAPGPSAGEERRQSACGEEPVRATFSTMIVMLSRPPFSRAASSIASTASPGSACCSRKCRMP